MLFVAKIAVSDIPQKNLEDLKLSTHPFPVHVFPSLIRNAIYEVERQTQAPLSLISASALGAISLVCQNRIDVCRLNGLCSPVSLFLLTLAESGERKSTVDKIFMKPLYQQEKIWFEKHSQDLQLWMNDKAAFIIKTKALESKIKSDTRRNKDCSITNEQLRFLFENKPKEPVRYRLMFNDATPAAIKDYLCGEWKSVGIMSDEAGTIFNGHTLNELPFINKMWDGSNFSVDRKNSPERLIHDARMTLSMMIQPTVFHKYIERKGDMAKGIGFFARCLICQPDSRQGFRQITSPVISSEHLPVFHSRLLEIVNDSIIRKGKGERMILRLSPQAEQLWISFYNRTESEMSEIGYLSNMKDYASKMAENMARIAALLHYFEGRNEDISIKAVEAAIQISAWYVDEYKRLFSKVSEFTLVNNESDELYSWIKNYCASTFPPHISKTKILQYGPYRFRNKIKMDELLNILLINQRIVVTHFGKILYIQPVQ